MTLAFLVLACTPKSGPLGETGDTTDTSGTDTSDTSAVLTLTSTAFADGESFPDDYTCAGADIQPELHWIGAPAGTRSFALTLLDESIDYVHWVAYDIDRATTALAEAASDDGVLPAGTHEAHAYGTEYRGPCPSGRLHTYTFTLRALDVATSAFTARDPIASADLEAAFGPATLASASLTGTSDASSR